MTFSEEDNLAKLAPITVAQAAELDRIERHAIACFRGQVEELESALGMLRLGYHVGWRVLVLVHNKRTIKKYEKILGIKIREQFPETGPSAERSLGYRMAKRIGSFWKIVSGDIKVEGRRVIDE